VPPYTEPEPEPVEDEGDEPADERQIPHPEDP
jgi:hypothetical protein